MFDKGELEALLRETVREVVAEELQALLFLEREAFIRENGGRKNGTYPRTLETPFGEISFRVPRDRQGRFKPSLFAPYARRTVDLADLVVTLFRGGLGTQGGGGDGAPSWASLLPQHREPDHRPCVGKGGGIPHVVPKVSAKVSGVKS